MSRLTPLAIALHGIGFGTLLTALHGLIAFDAPLPRIEIAYGRGSLGVQMPAMQERSHTQRRRNRGVFHDVQYIDDEEEALAALALVI